MIKDYSKYKFNLFITWIAVLIFPNFRANKKPFLYAFSTNSIGDNLHQSVWVKHLNVNGLLPECPGFHICADTG